MKKLKEYDFGNTRRGFDWSFLDDGGIYQLSAGEDFSIKPGSLVQSAREYAKTRGEIRVSVSGDTVTVQLDTSKPPRPTKPREPKPAADPVQPAVVDADTGTAEL